MNASAHPTRRTELLTEEAVLRHRSLFCVEYDDCLAIAASAGWRSWSCENCPLANVVAFPIARARPLRASPSASGAGRASGPAPH